MKTNKLKEFLKELKEFDNNTYEVNHISIRNEKNKIENAMELYNLWASWTKADAIQSWNWSDWKTNYKTHILYHSSNKWTNFEKIINFLLTNLNHTAGNEYWFDYNKKIPTHPITKSPVDYWKKVINECKSNECRLKYWKDGCGFNIEASMEMQKNPKYNFFWQHDKKEEKIFSFGKNFSKLDVLNVPDSYIFQIWTKWWWVVLDFWLRFTEYGGLVFPKENKNEIIKKLKSYWFKEKK